MNALVAEWVAKAVYYKQFFESDNFHTAAFDASASTSTLACD